MMKILIIIVIVWTVEYSHAQRGSIRNNHNQYNQYADYPSDNNRDIRACYGLPCPRGTTQCSTKSETSADHKRLMTTMECKDYYGSILNSAVKSTVIPNFFGVIFNHGSGGHYGGSSGGYYMGGSYHGNGGSGSYSNSGSKGSGGSYSSGRSANTFGGSSSSMSYAL